MKKEHGIGGYSEKNIDKPGKPGGPKHGISGYSERNLEPMSTPPKGSGKKPKADGYGHGSK